MKIKQTEIKYVIGDLVTIPDFKLIEDFEKIPYRSNWVGQMNDYIGTACMISAVDPGRDDRSYYYLKNIETGNDIPFSWNWSFFKESYDIEDNSEIGLYEGMYLYHAESNRHSDHQILMQIYKIDTEENSVKCRFIRYNSRTKYNLLELHLKGNQYSETININNDTRFVSVCLYVPTNEELMSRWGVTNRETSSTIKIADGQLPIPDFFSNLKHRPRKIKYFTKTSYGSIITIGYLIKKPINVIVDFYNNKQNITKPTSVLSDESLKLDDLKELIKAWGKVKIKSIDASINLFGHIKRKTIMFENSNKTESKERIIYKINKVMFNLQKDGVYHHVVELNDGNFNLKFLLSDLDITLPNADSYIAPKDRSINVGNDCKIIKDKLLPLSKGNNVTILKTYNRHKSTSKTSIDKNTIAIVVDKQTNKQFECKIKQLKRI